MSGTTSRKKPADFLLVGAPGSEGGSVNTAYRWFGVALMVAVAIAPGLKPGPAEAATAAEIDRDASAELEKLFAHTPKAKSWPKLPRASWSSRASSRPVFWSGACMARGRSR